MKATELAGERLEAVGRRHAQVIEARCSVELRQLSQGRLHDIRWNPPRPCGCVAVEQVCGQLVRKGPDHWDILTLIDNACKAPSPSVGDLAMTYSVPPIKTHDATGAYAALQKLTLPGFGWLGSWV
jgi:hypothetical protein